MIHGASIREPRIFRLQTIFLTVCLVLSISTLQIRAQQRQSETKDTTLPYKIEVLTDRPNAIYAANDEIEFRIRMLEGEKALPDRKLDYAITGDNKLSVTGSVTSGAEPAVARVKLPQPGFALCRVTYTHPDSRQVSGLGGAGIDPLQISARRQPPADFNSFWTAARDELAKVPMKDSLTPVEIRSDKHRSRVECFDVKITCAGDMPVSGYLARPANATNGSCPIFISYHSAGVRSAKQPLDRGLQGMLAFDVNAHGIENGKPESFYADLAAGSLKGYNMRNIDDPQKIYFRGMFLRALRALEYMKSRPEWDGKTLIVFGSSMAGGQALFAAGSDPKVTCCIAFVPALCYHTGILDGHNSGWPQFIKLKDGQPENEAIVKTIQYYDAATFASKITNATCFLSAGLIDTVCAPTSVYVAYNGIASKNKSIIPNPLTGHAVSKEASTAAEAIITEHLKEMK